MRVKPSAIGFVSQFRLATRDVGFVSQKPCCRSIAEHSTLVPRNRGQGPQRLFIIATLNSAERTRNDPGTMIHAPERSERSFPYLFLMRLPASPAEKR